MTGGGCHCGAVRYEIEGEPRHAAVCHCEDCRKCAGAAGVAWMAVGVDEFAVVEGEPTLYRSSADGRRYFCGACGSGLYYVNEKMLPGLVDVQIATLDDPERYAPQAHIQTADELSWESQLADLPRFERYPG